MNVLCDEKCNVSDGTGIFHFPSLYFIICFPSALQMNIQKTAWVWLNLYSKYVTTRHNKIYRIKNPLLTCKNHEGVHYWPTSSPSCALRLTSMQRRQPLHSERLALRERGRWNEQLATATSLEFISSFKVRQYIKDRGHSSIYMVKTATAVAFSSSWNYSQY